MRFAVLGAAGQLGCELCARLPGEVIALGRSQIDLARPDAIPATVATLGADVFINCAAYNFVDRAESEPDAAFAVNAWGVRALARACRAAKVKLVHFSTDYVFGIESSRTQPYEEVDLPGPLGVYGLSKLAGEYLCRAECPDALVIRTCGLYGAAGSGGKGGNFVETMLRLAGEGKPIRVVDDQRCTPSYAADVAEATTALVGVGATGLFHITNAGSCTWYEFAAEIFRLYELKPNLTSIASSDYNSPARRPSFSVLSTAKAAAAGIAVPQPWRSALDSYLAERRARTRTQTT
jgi:dTDP-4-dehydrorhamnose reductase